jgi:hypothetical protein
VEARDDKRLLRLQAQLQSVRLLIVDELGYVPLSQIGAELLFKVFLQHYERGSTVVTSNLPFEEWPSVFRSERLTGALLDRLTHHVHILELNGESYRLRQSKGRRPAGMAAQIPAASVPPETPAEPRSRRRLTPQIPTAVADARSAPLARYSAAVDMRGFDPVPAATGSVASSPQAARPASNAASARREIEGQRI